MRQFAAIGEAMVELYQQQERTLGLNFAGDSLNTATYLARLLPTTQTQVNYITLLGTDPYSEMMLADWQREGMNTTYIEQLSHKLPGLYLIRTDAQGERTFYFYRSQSAARELFNPEHATRMKPILLQMDYLYLSNITLAILEQDNYKQLLELLKQAKARGIAIIFDTNYRPSLWPSVAKACQVTQEIMSLVDISLVTLDDEKKLFGDSTPNQCAARLHRFGAKEVVVKCGAEPCLVSFAGKQSRVSGYAVEKVVDTTAAGDSFNAGYLAARWQQCSPIEAARYGHAVASCVIQYPGAIISRRQMGDYFRAQLLSRGDSADPLLLFRNLANLGTEIDNLNITNCFH